MIVWGGTTERAGVGGLLDGAAYDLATDTWRSISNSPPGTDRVNAASASAAGRAVFAGGDNSTASAGGSVLTYDPEANTWNETNARGKVVAATTLGDQVLATVEPERLSELNIETFDPRTTARAPLPDFPLTEVDDTIDSVGLAASDAQIFASATTTNGNGGSQSTTVAVLADGANQWEARTTLDNDDFTPGSQLQVIYPPGPTAWTGTWLVGWSSSPTAMAPGTDRSVDRIDQTAASCIAAGVAVWTGDQILEWGGQNCRRIGPSPQLNSGVSIEIDLTS